MTNIILSQLFGNSIEQEFGLQNFSAEEKSLIINKIEERLQTVILESAVNKMSEEQFKEFQNIVESAQQTELNGLTSKIPGLEQSIKENLLKEVAALKKITKGN